MKSFFHNLDLPFFYKRRTFPTTKVIGVILAVVGVSLLLWYFPVILSSIQNSSQNTDSISDYSYTNLTLRDSLKASEVETQIIEFDDAVYSIKYFQSKLYLYAPFQSMDYIPKEGRTYNDLGLEIKISNIGSDYLSNFIEIQVRPTIENYMFSTYHYTKVDIPLENMRTANITSGLINRTNEYIFSYTNPPSIGHGAGLVVRNETQRGIYQAYVNMFVPEAKDDFDLEIRVYKADSENMIIYVKPLY